MSRTFGTLRAIRQCGPHRDIIVVDIVAIRVHVAIVVDIRGIVIIVARRAQPPNISTILTLNPSFRTSSRRS